MAGQIYYKVLKDIKLTLICYNGIVDLDIFKDHTIKLGNDPDYDPCFNAITDFGDCEFLVSNQDVKKAVDLLKNSESLIGQRKHAFIFRTARQQVISSLFSMLSGDLPVVFNVVSSLREAKSYIELNPAHYPLVQQEFIRIRD